MNALTIKKAGIHYTPPALARFLAQEIVKVLDPSIAKLKILDPACGDGSLLSAIKDEVPSRRVSKIHGLDTSFEAIQSCRSRLPKSKTVLGQEDFLAQTKTDNKFDVVIANPPFVRTQVLGGKRAQELSEQFGLSGRVDLYHAFAAQIANALKPSGVMGLITSNRFLTTKSGLSMRRLLREKFSIESVFDLGDTRLFGAAVLPAIVIATRNSESRSTKSSFTRVYANSSATKPPAKQEVEALLDWIGQKSSGSAKAHPKFKVERGFLDFSGQADSAWALSNLKSRAWLKKIHSHQVHKFGDLAEIKVGIKTTADAVFIGDDWKSLKGRSPESKLLQPLITHHCAKRWAIAGNDSPQDSTHQPLKQVLYPYDMAASKRTVVGLGRYPRTQKYLQSHRQRLQGRKYVVDSGRKWFEIWVPHQPADWAKPKIVWPDISEEPKFFLDSSGAIVNGDCYWIKLRKDVDADWLYMMLAVANSKIATTFYDTVFHNKLYANRRRFMTQYVKDFPLPDLNSKIGKQIVSWAKKQVEKPTPSRELKLETLVQRAFGFE